MTLRTCLILPVYNPGPALRRTVEALVPFGFPLYLTDDGSDEATRVELIRLAQEHPLIRMTRLPENQGKGAAVMEAMRRAFRDGFTHALQVDADGQHDAAAVTPFLELSRTHPEAVIAGVPVYDGPVPAVRKYGRHLTHLWVWIETCSRDIGDSLCGFRVYPLASTVQLIDRVAIPARMDFDTELIVRLHWAGVPVLNAPVRVIYPKDGVSHFRLVQDNVRITRMHTRLFFGMLRRLPRLLFRRRPVRTAEPHWSKIAERGTTLGLRTLLWTYRLLGRRAVQLLTETIVVYFFLTGGIARRASRQYLDCLFAFGGPLPGLTRPPGLRESYRHVRTFATSYVDKFLAWMDCADHIRVEFPDQAAFEALRCTGKGAIFLSGHVGNLDMLRALGAAEGLTGLNAVIYSGNGIRLQALLKEINPNFVANLIHVSDVGPETAIALEAKIEQGELLFIVGDRTPVAENGRTVQVPFLGKPAPFPIGPYVLAHLLRCPVYLFYCLREGDRYRIRMRLLAERVELPRQGREAAILQWVQQYAKSLEDCCLTSPYEWFNFFDVWSPGSPLSPDPSR